MKNKILMSLVTMLITTGAANAFEIGGITFFEKPIQDKYLSVSNGGTLPDNQALKDGVGVIIVSSPVSAENRVDTTLNNKALLNYADLAAEEGVTVKNYIATNDVDPDLKTAVLSNTLFTADTTADTAVSDNPLDPVILSNGTVTCANAQVGNTLTNGYLVVDRNLLDNAINNGEDFSKLCTTHVSDMSFLFESRDVNYDITKWDVSNVFLFDYMFANTTNFNQNISNWNVSNADTMAGMFMDSAFNQPIGNWNVLNASSFNSMFANTTNFNQNISNWNVSNVRDMTSMFEGASAFNQPIGSWDVSNVSYMFSMFANSAFNQPIGNWNVSNVTDMSRMFSGSDFNQDISAWNVSNVTNMSDMFSMAFNFNQPIGSWNVSSVTNMNFMFSGAYNFNQDLTAWNVSNVTNYEQFDADATNWEDRYKPNFP